MSKEPTRHQLSSRLAYNAHTPAFLLRLQHRVAGTRGEDEEDDEFEYDESGRPSIPRRPSIPERPEDDRGSADEDDVDEKPQVVVLKEGKHLTERDVENEKRRAKGLPPLPDPSSTSSEEQHTADSSPFKSGKEAQGLSFSSTKTGSKSKIAKRKAIGDPAAHTDDETTRKPSKKRAKKAERKLLSFNDGDEA